MSITYREYWTEVKETAASVIEDARNESPKDASFEDIREDVYDSRLHEYVDRHEYAIYYAHHLPILQHSDNAEYMVDNFGGESAETAIREGGITGLHAGLAFWAFYADVSDELSHQLEELESEIDAA